MNRWFGSQCYLGYHADLHLWDDDTDAGTRALPDELEASLRLLNPDWIQVDSKGHAGYTSWFSKVPEATVAPHLVHDAVRAWREASRRLHIPMVCHYSGFLDYAAALKHPEWLATLPLRKDRPPLNVFEAWMCPRSAYFDELMIPQMIELASEYGVDGFWVDGDAWGYHGCWCPQCIADFREKTGIEVVPYAPEDEHWEDWWHFHFEHLLLTVEHYCDKVHAVCPDVRICSSWLDTNRFPARNRGHVDWLSGDVAPTWTQENCRSEVRWLSHRPQTWDLMSWPHLCAPDFPIKSVDMLCQEAAQIIANGGRYIFCECVGGVRSSQQPSWRLRRLAEVGKFVRARQSFCQDTESCPEVAVLCGPAPSHSLLVESFSPAARVAVSTLLECHYGVDFLDEDGLLTTLNQYKVVVIPEAGSFTDVAVQALQQYVKAGGRLLVSGVENIRRFPPEFFGIQSMEEETVSPFAGKRWGFAVGKDSTPLYFLPERDAVFPLASKSWGLIKEVPESVRFRELYRSYVYDESATGCPAGLMRSVGRGKTAVIPADFFTGIAQQHYLPEARCFLGGLMKALYPDREIEVEAPSFVELALRKKENTLLIHLLNRNTGCASHPDRWMVDEIPAIGGISLQVRCKSFPRCIRVMPEGKKISFQWHENKKGGVCRINDLTVRIHSTVVIEF